jgi:hypothetical protein
MCAAVIALLVAGVVLLLASNRWLSRHVGDQCRLGTPSFHDAGEIADTIAKLGPDGRRSYLVFLWTFDLVGPLVYGAALYFWISLWIAQAWPGAPLATQLRWIAVAAAASDYVENVVTTVLLLGHAKEARFLAAACGLATLIKWSLYGAALAVALIAGAVIGIHYALGSAGTPPG